MDCIKALDEVKNIRSLGSKSTDASTLTALTMKVAVTIYLWVESARFDVNGSVENFAIQDSDGNRLQTSGGLRPIIKLKSDAVLKVHHN